MRPLTVGIILAAGKGSRLHDVIPPYFKPLLVVEKKTMVAAAVDALQKHVDEVVIVVAPENAKPIADVVGDSADLYVVQPQAIGPGDALRRATLHLNDSDSIVVVMGDNIVRESDIESIVQREDQNVVCGCYKNSPDSERYTRFVSETKRWVEGPYSTYENTDTHSFVWLGPIKLNVGDWRTARVAAGDMRNQIGPLFNLLPNEAVRSMCEAHDIGVKEALP